MRTAVTGDPLYMFIIPLDQIYNPIIISAYFVEFSCFPQIYKMQGYPAWVTITAAVVLSVTGRRVFLPHVKEVVTMIDIDTVIAIITLAVTAIGLGLQIASYINASKNDRPTSQK